MSEVDKDLSERYRAASAEAPPSHVDAAILAASKRAVGSQPQATWTPRAVRRWYVPVSLAAVLVLSVVVTLQVERERPEIAMPDAVPVGRKDQVQPLRAPAAPPAALEPKAKAEAGSAVTPAAEPARKKTAPAFAPDPKTAAIPEAKRDAEPGLMQRQGQDALSASDTARGAAAAGRVANEKIAESPAPAAAPPTPPAQAQAGAQAFGIAADSAGARREARAMSAPAPAAATAQLAKRELPPEEWLERIADLRKQRRDREADEQFAEFKRRYPDYKIPEAMSERIAPRK